MIDDVTLQRCLEDLEERIDEEEEQRNRDEWLTFVNGECREEIFTPSPRTPAPPKVDWPAVSVNQAVADENAMLMQQFRTVSDALENGSGRRHCVRCNYGTGIVPCLFGCEFFLMDEELNTLPTAMPFNSREKVRELLDAGMPDLANGLGARVFATGRLFVETMAKCPKISKYVSLIHPDTQGPIDVLEVVWGSEFFYAVYDDIALVKAFLDLVTDTYIAFLREWFTIRPQETNHSDHWGLMYKGVVMLREDSLMNLSPEFYADHVRPVDQRVFDEFGGGGVHFCGRGEHFIEALSGMTGLHAVNPSQPEYNDMEIIYRNTIDKGIALVNLKRDAAEKANRPLRGLVHCP